MIWTSIVGALLLTAACGADSTTTPTLPENPGRMTITLESPAFSEGEAIPKTHTCDGKNVSPPLSWSGVPKSAKSLALICEDPDAPGGLFTHWILYDLPVDREKLDEAVAGGEPVVLGGVRQGKNDFGAVGYGGPCPPSGTHRYVFRLLALDQTPDLAPGASRRQLVESIRGRVVAEGKLTGRYAR
jgi:Raf kinase inhibitor-like YbhB/YbcL family protein